LSARSIVAMAFQPVFHSNCCGLAPHESPVRAWFVLEFLTLRSLDHLIGKLLSLFSVQAVDSFNVTEVSVRVMYSLCQSSDRAT
jgi:hypothetical protein